MTARRLVLGMALIVAALTALRTGGDLDLGVGPQSSLPSRTASPAEGTYHRPAGGDLDELLDQVDVVDERPSVPAYDRQCGTEHACSFGPEWTDDVDVAGGHNGCDTRIICIARGLGS